MKNILHNKLLNIASYIVITASFIMLLVLLFWSLYPYEPLVLNKRPFTIVNKTVKMGDTLEYKVDYCKTTNARVTIKRKFEDGLLFALPDTETTNPKGCRVQTIALEVPHSLPAGDYILLVEFVYQVNPVRQVVVRTHTEKFTVIE